jgi:hypothetical protein
MNGGRGYASREATNRRSPAARKGRQNYGEDGTPRRSRVDEFALVPACFRLLYEADPRVRCLVGRSRGHQKALEHRG